MEKQKVEKLLDRLDGEISRLDSLPEREKRQLDELVEKIKSGIDEDERTADDLHESLTASVSRFEASHPRLTAIINDIMVTLSNMGI